MLGVVGSSLKMAKFEPTTPNMSQHGGQTSAKMWLPTMLRYVVLACFDHFAEALGTRFAIWRLHLAIRDFNPVNTASSVRTGY